MVSRYSINARRIFARIEPGGTERHWRRIPPRGDSGTSRRCGSRISSATPPGSAGCRLRFRDVVAALTGTTVLLSTHLIDDVDAVCDRVIVLHGAAIRFTGTTAELKRQDDPAMPGNTPLERRT